MSIWTVWSGCATFWGPSSSDLLCAHLLSAGGGGAGVSVVDVDVGRVRVVIKSWERKEKKCACSLFYVTIVRFTVIDDHAPFFPLLFWSTLDS